MANPLRMSSVGRLTALGAVLAVGVAFGLAMPTPASAGYISNYTVASPNPATLLFLKGQGTQDFSNIWTTGFDPYSRTNVKNADDTLKDAYWSLNNNWSPKTWNPQGSYTNYKKDCHTTPPIPEPQGVALFFAGLLVVGGFGLRSYGANPAS